MMDPEIRISEIFQTYKRYWWLAIIVFMAGSALGFFLPENLMHDVTIAKFSVPVVVREQVSPQWSEEDDYALQSFVYAWLSEEWKTTGGIAFPEGKVDVILEEDTFYFLLEQDHRVTDTEVMDDLADTLFTEFLLQFIDMPQSLEIVVIDNSACLTDAAREEMIQCIPTTPVLSDIVQSEAFHLGKLLWVGERSDVTLEAKMPHVRIVHIAAAGISAEMILLMVFLFSLSRRITGGSEE